MFELDRTRSKVHMKLISGLVVVETNGKHSIVQDGDGDHWMTVPAKGGFDLYPMRAI